MSLDYLENLKNDVSIRGPRKCLRYIGLMRHKMTSTEQFLVQTANTKFS